MNQLNMSDRLTGQGPLMTTIALDVMIDADGTLRLTVPVGLPAGPAKVSMTVEPVEPPVGTETDVPRRMTSARSGLFVGDPALQALDIDAVRKEINDAWKKKLMEGL